MIVLAFTVVAVGVVIIADSLWRSRGEGGNL